MSADDAQLGLQTPPAPRAFVGHARLISALTLLSRILGMLRESIAALYFGAGLVWSAFTVAFTIPNLFRKLFGEGALSAAFIPLYAQSLQSDPAEARRFAAASVNLQLALLVVLTILGELVLWSLPPLWERLAGNPMRPDRLLTVKLTAIMLPYVLLVCGTALLSGILQVHRRFGLPAFAPVILNVSHIAVMVIGARLLHLQASTAGAQLLERQTRLVYWLAGSVLVAGAAQVAILLPSLRAVGFRFTWLSNLWTPAVKRMLMLTIPVALGAGVLQLSVLLDRGISLMLSQGVDEAGKLITQFSIFGQAFRYPMEMGAPARLAWAQFLYQFPLGVFAIALATAIFPGLSANALDADRQQFRSVLRHGIEVTMLEGIAASVGLMLVARPAVRLLFEHGHFTPHDTDLVVRSVMFYSVAIWAFSLQQILNRAYYALHDTVTPLIMSVVTLVVNLAVEIPLVWPLGEAGMAAGTSASFAVQALIMLAMLNRQVGGLELSRSAPYIGKLLVAGAAMAAVCVAIQYLPHWPRGGGKRIALAQLILLMGVGAAVYGSVARMLGIDMLEHVVPARWRRRA